MGREGHEKKSNFIIYLMSFTFFPHVPSIIRGRPCPDARRASWFPCGRKWITFPQYLCKFPPGYMARKVSMDTKILLVPLGSSPGQAPANWVTRIGIRLLMDHEARNQSSINHQDRNQSSLNHQARSQSSVNHQARNQSSISDQTRKQSSYNYQAKNQYSTNHQARNQSLINHQARNQSSFNHQTRN